MFGSDRQINDVSFNREEEQPKKVVFIKLNYSYQKDLVTIIVKKGEKDGSTKGMSPVGLKLILSKKTVRE